MGDDGAYGHVAAGAQSHRRADSHGHACVDGGPAIITATAMLPSELFHIPAWAIRSLMVADPHVAQFMLRTMAWLTRLAFNKIRENSTLPSVRLVPHVLYQQYLQAREAGLGSEATILRLSQVDVSNMCGLSPKSVSRVLQTLKARGVVSLTYNGITILDHQALGRAAEGGHAPAIRRSPDSDTPSRSGSTARAPVKSSPSV